jgi:hypothetical protein
MRYIDALCLVESLAKKPDYPILFKVEPMTQRLIWKSEDGKRKIYANGFGSIIFVMGNCAATASFDWFFDKVKNNLPLPPERSGE